MVELFQLQMILVETKYRLLIILDAFYEVLVDILPIEAMIPYIGPLTYIGHIQWVFLLLLASDDINFRHSIA